MLSTIILLTSGVLGIFWTSKVRNQFTKFCAFLISIAVLTLIIPHHLTRSYGPYFLAFACFMAGFEPGSSRRIKTFHKIYFGISGVLFAAVAVDRVIIWPLMDIQFWPLLLLFLIVTGLFMVKDPKMVKTRLTYLYVWIGMGLDHLIRLI